MRVSPAALIFLSLFLLGCYDWRAEVVKQASFDHNCPEPQIAILADNGDGMARAVRLNVCGDERMYRDIGGSQIYLWQDMTSGGEAE